MSQSSNPWKAFESIPGMAAVMAEWEALLGDEVDLFRNLFRPNGKQAQSYPCQTENGCGCHHTVIQHSSSDIVAVCHCGAGCDSFELTGTDIAIYELKRDAFDAAIGNIFNLFEKASNKTDIPTTTQIGVYSPYAGFRFPVFLTIQLESSEFENAVDSILARNESPFILCAPTRELCKPGVETRLRSNKCLFIPLSETIKLNDRTGNQLHRPMPEVFEPFLQMNLPKKDDSESIVFFPTPADATWKDVSILFKDGYTVSIKVKAEKGVFNYTQMGMANKKNTDPTLQWKLLQAFAEEHGEIDWSSGYAHKRNQKRRENLSKDLKQFFRIEGDPIGLTEDGNGWKTRFTIQPVSINR